MVRSDYGNGFSSFNVAKLDPKMISSSEATKKSYGVRASR
jgi:hypothetical protein